MLLTSTGVIPGSQHQEESALLLRKIEELNKNTRLIAEAVKLVQESKQLSARVKSLETPTRS
jgi:mannose/cellobiose epimerase-like protein (N-acyl-D-glucosamine 2-epimerase family)